MRVGARMIATTLAEGHLRGSFDVKDEVVSHLWLLNALKANLAFTLAQRHAVGVAPEPAYTYGLLHDVGRLVLAALWRNATREIIEDDPFPREIVDRETHDCGVAHTMAGRLLGNRWKLPADVVLVGAAHHMDRAARMRYPADVNAAIELVAIVDEAVHAAARGSATPDDASRIVAERLAHPGVEDLLEATKLAPDQVGDAMKPALAAVARQRRSLGLAAAGAGRLPV
jgi:HD-like signal output (HDOD) protein